MSFERIGESLYRKGDAIYARVRVNRKLTWRSTGTSEPREARKWLKKWKTEEGMEQNSFEPKGVILHRAKVTVADWLRALVCSPQRAGGGEIKSFCFCASDKAWWGESPFAPPPMSDHCRWLPKAVLPLRVSVFG